MPTKHVFPVNIWFVLTKNNDSIELLKFIMYIKGVSKIVIQTLEEGSPYQNKITNL